MATTWHTKSLPARNDDLGRPQHASAAVRIAVVVPAFRAEALIARVVRGFAPLADWVIVVDDASPDATSERVHSLSIDNVVLIRHDRNRGVGGAVKSGIAAAIEHGADIVVKADADDQMDPDWLAALLDPILRNEADVAKGNRWYDRNALRTMPRARRYGNVALAFLTRLASGQWQVFDPNNGYIAWRSDLLRLMDLAGVPDRYTFEAGMLIETGMLGGLVRDVPIPARYGSEISHLSLRRALLDFSRFLAIGTLRRFWRRHFVYDFTPVSLFLVFGAILAAFGTTFGALKWIESVRTGVPATAGTVVLAALPVLLGANMLLQALVLDIHSVPRQKLCRDLPRRALARTLAWRNARARDPGLPRMNSPSNSGDS